MQSNRILVVVLGVFVGACTGSTDASTEDVAVDTGGGTADAPETPDADPADVGGDVSDATNSDTVEDSIDVADEEIADSRDTIEPEVTEDVSPGDISADDVSPGDVDPSDAFDATDVGDEPETIDDGGELDVADDAHSDTIDDAFEDAMEDVPPDPVADVVEDPFDPCEPNPCQNGASCIPFGPSPSCECVGEWTGEFCEECGTRCASRPSFFRNRFLSCFEDLSFCDRPPQTCEEFCSSWMGCEGPLEINSNGVGTVVGPEASCF